MMLLFFEPERLPTRLFFLLPRGLDSEREKAGLWTTAGKGRKKPFLAQGLGRSSTSFFPFLSDDFPSYAEIADCEGFEVKVMFLLKVDHLTTYI
jgi:hypothetical protein